MPWFIHCFFAHCSSPGSRDGYFEMGLDDSVEESICSSSTSLAAPPAEESGDHQGEPLCDEEELEVEEQEEEEEEEEVQVQVQVHVRRVLWCYCLQVEEEVEQREVCLVLTDRLLGLLYLPDDFTWTNLDTGKHTVGHRQTLFTWSLTYLEALVTALGFHIFFA